MIIPTLTVVVLDRTAHDRFGQPTLTPAGREKVAVVKLIFTDQQTTVRTDSSASHGQARETVADVVLLAVPRTTIKHGDALEIAEGPLRGKRVVVSIVHPRYDVLGRLDHIELACEAWV